MAVPALVDKTAFAAASNFSATSASISTVGYSLLTASANQYDVDPNTITISDLCGNTWLHTTSYGLPATESRSTLWYSFTALSCTSDTLTVQGNFLGVVFASWSGTKISATPLDQQNGSASVSGTSPQTFGSITPSVAGTLVISTLGAPPTSTTPYTAAGLTAVASQAYSGSNNEGVSAAYIVQGAASAVNPSWSWTGGTSTSAGLNVSFLPPSASTAKRASQGFTF